MAHMIRPIILKGPGCVSTRYRGSCLRGLPKFIVIRLVVTEIKFQQPFKLVILVL